MEIAFPWMHTSINGIFLELTQGAASEKIVRYLTGAAASFPVQSPHSPRSLPK